MDLIGPIDSSGLIRSSPALEALLDKLEHLETVACGAEATYMVEADGVTYSSYSLLWMLLCAFLVFFMQAGFGMLEAGAVRAKNAKNILLKNIVDAAVGGLSFWIIGYGIAYGTSNPFIGGSGFFFANLKDFAFWLFQFAFAATAATIVSGAVAERTQFRAYLAYTFFISGFIYPVVVHWVWSGEGFLSQFNPDSTKVGPGMIDFAGSGVVHMTGGMLALVGAIVVGPRHGRFVHVGQDKSQATFTSYLDFRSSFWRERKGGKWEVRDLSASNSSAAVLGTFILWLGWYGFNPGSTLSFAGGAQLVAERTAMTTTLAASFGALSSFLLMLALSKGRFGALDGLINGTLAGLVGITAGCSVVDLWAAAVIGILAGAAYVGAHHLLLKLKIDDPLDAAPIHLFVGALGVLLVGFFAHPMFVSDAYGVEGCATYFNGSIDEACRSTVGVFYGGNGTLLGVQVLGIVCIAAWCGATGFVLFIAIRAAKALRVKEEHEKMGLDEAKHGGYAFPDFHRGEGETEDALLTRPVIPKPASSKRVDNES
uniref:Ammonium transporter n=1 Tax=Palpitomonas bilix TaxID=652834 RepID=A0A7S3CV10_9EUKA|mmetsp:Transcript_10495/g.27475  ORF Transcript_10495/g.27475 Transcript_10495/m.27475 type:complete len:540 (+) Transcript_10495:84-1703(+)